MINNFFFSFESFEKEIEKKLFIQKLNSKIIFEKFLLNLKNFQNININSIKKTFEILNSLPFNDIYNNYLTHPIRVADMFGLIDKNQNDEKINFALCHNIIESGFLNKVKKINLNHNQLKKIEILTIDRDSEYNENYLNKYYDQIENFSSDLILFKCCDKLDNTLLGNKDILGGNHHFHIVKQHVCPRAKKYNSKLANYLYELVEYIEKQTT